MMAGDRAANSLLRKARRSRLSPSGSGRVMSRRELADAVNAWMYAHCGQSREVVDGSHIGKLERGEIRWPRVNLRAALRAVLGAETDREIGLYIAYDRERVALPSETLSSAELADGFANLGDLLRKWRKAADLTQVVLAQRVQYSRTTVANVEIGRDQTSRAFWSRVDHEVGAGGVLLDEFDRLDTARRMYQAARAAERAYRVAGASDSSAAVAKSEEGCGALILPVHHGSSSALTLSISTTERGGLRVVIETGPVPSSAPNGGGLLALPEAGNTGDSNGDSAQVLPMDAARHDRKNRLA